MVIFVSDLTWKFRDTWLRCMDRFAEFIFNIPHSIEQKAESRVVRIAIIDDGVDTHLPEFMNADIGGGVSFHTRGRLQDTPQATFTHHFPSTGGHGTEMAMRVRQVFPKAKLYIARLNVAFGENGNPTITASSAADVSSFTPLVTLITLKNNIGN